MQVDRTIYPYESAEDHLGSGHSLEAFQDCGTDNGPAILAICHQAEKLGITGTGDIGFYMNHQSTQTGSALDRAISFHSKTPLFAVYQEPGWDEV
jgi:hypothetical protein